MKKYILPLLALMIMSSCSGFLDEQPKGNITTESYFKTETHALSATNAIYDYLIAGYSPGGLWDNNFGGVFFNYYWVLQDVFSDNAHSHMTATEYQSIENFQIDPYNEPLEYLWRDFYQVIKTCNVVIDKVPGINMNTTLRDNLVAEARFFRAYMYFDLMRMFGEVPLRTHDMTGAEDELLPRAPKDEIYQVIFDDLDYAEQHLVDPSRQLDGMPKSISATALKARVFNTYAAENRSNEYWQKAVECAQKVIAECPMLASFADLFKIENKFNSEIAWAANFSATLSEGWKGGQFLVRLLPSLDTSKGGPNNAQGWESATENLWEAYNMTDSRRDITLKKSFTYNDNSKVTLEYPYVFKYWDQAAEPNGNNCDAEFPAIRTAEMYLIVAEALNEINNAPTAEATAALKEVRSRAKLKGTIPSDYAAFKAEVLKQYRLEFVMEGHRWFDLKRMCTPEEFVSIIQEAKPDATPKAYHMLFPIPQREINLSEGLITQNPGYTNAQ